MKSCLAHIEHFWGEVAPGHDDWIDVDSVKMLEFRAPQHSEKDRKWLADKMESGELLATVLDRDIRHAIFERVMRWPYLIPSLTSFFADFNYMVLLQKVLRLLINLKSLEKPLRDEYYDIFVQQARTSVLILNDRNEAEWVYLPVVNKEHQFNIHLCVLYTVVMRRWPRLVDEKPRMANRRASRNETGLIVRRDMWPNIAQTALHLGFRTAYVEELAGRTPGVQTRTVDPLRKFVVDEGQAGVALDHRCGVPFDSEMPEDEASLFYNTLSSAPTETGSDITPLYVRNVFFRVWFGAEPLDLANCIRLDPDVNEQDVNATNGWRDGDGIGDNGIGDHDMEDNLGLEPDEVSRELDLLAEERWVEGQLQEEQRLEEQRLEEQRLEEQRLREEQREEQWRQEQRLREERRRQAQRLREGPRRQRRQEPRQRDVHDNAPEFVTFKIVTHGKRSTTTVPAGEVNKQAEDYVKQGYSLQVGNQMVNFNDCFNALTNTHTREVWVSRRNNLLSAMQESHRARGAPAVEQGLLETGDWDVDI
jgi:hypothetical protein